MQSPFSWQGSPQTTQDFNRDNSHETQVTSSQENREGKGSGRASQRGSQQSEAKSRQSKVERALFGPRTEYASSATTVGTGWGPVRIWLCHVQESPSYKVIISLCIIFNCISLVLETDQRAAHREMQKLDPTLDTFVVPTWMTESGVVLVAVYIADLAVRMYVERKKFWHKFANNFDFAIVFTDFILLFVSDDLPSVAVLRVFRIARVVRVLRSFLVFRELYLMMQGLVSAIRAIVFAALLILVGLTIWSILAVEFVHELNVKLDADGAYGDCRRCRDAFSTVFRANLTFLQSIVAGDSWGLMSLPLIETYPATALIIISALLTIQLGLLNLIIAVIVDRAAAARADDEALKHTEKMETLDKSYRRLVNLFEAMDADGSGALSLEELAESYDEHADFREILNLMDIQKCDLALVFEILDKNRDKEVDYTEFVEMLHEMKTFDSHTLLTYVKHYTTEIHHLVESQLALLQDKMNDHEANLVDVKRSAILLAENMSEMTRDSTACLEGDFNADGSERISRLARSRQATKDIEVNCQNGLVHEHGGSRRHDWCYTVVKAKLDDTSEAAKRPSEKARDASLVGDAVALTAAKEAATAVAIAATLAPVEQQMNGESGEGNGTLPPGNLLASTGRDDKKPDIGFAALAHVDVTDAQDKAERLAAIKAEKRRTALCSVAPAPVVMPTSLPTWCQEQTFCVDSAAHREPALPGLPPAANLVYMQSPNVGDMPSWRVHAENSRDAPIAEEGSIPSPSGSWRNRAGPYFLEPAISRRVRGDPGVWRRPPVPDTMPTSQHIGRSWPPRSRSASGTDASQLQGSSPNPGQGERMRGPSAPPFHDFDMAIALPEPTTKGAFGATPVVGYLQPAKRSISRNAEERKRLESGKLECQPEPLPVGHGAKTLDVGPPVIPTTGGSLSP